jgi:hypothetical protein
MSKNKLRFICLFIGVIALSVATYHAYAQEKSPTDQNLDIRYVSIINLIANPFRFHDSVVRVIGLVRVSPKGTAVYLTRSDAEYEVTKNGIWINVDEDMKARIKECDLQVCGVVGKFDANNPGPQGLWNGSFSKIIAIGPLNKE